MEMDPSTAPFQRILGNPFAYTAFKSTEPWLQVTSCELVFLCWCYHF